MTQLTSDCFRLDGSLTPLDEALRIIAQCFDVVVGDEEIDLRAARGRVLAEDLIAPSPLPPCDNSAVDGYAVASEHLFADAPTRLIIAGRAAAGHPFKGTMDPGTAVRIFTGAAMPVGADTVIMQEECAVEGDRVLVPARVKPGVNCRRAGEDVQAGSTVLKRGRTLRPQDLALAAAVGRARIRVFQPLRAAVLSTGDELRSPDEPLGPGDIRDANRYALIAFLEDAGCVVTDVGIIKDDYHAIRTNLARAAASHDVIVTSGGMSVGEEDHVKAAVKAMGDLHLWRLAIKPGRPLGIGRIGDVPFVGLPGNPVAMVVTFLRIARPMILRLAGCRDVEPRRFRVVADFALDKKAGRLEWVRASLVDTGSGTPVARRFSRQGSGILSSIIDSDGLVELAEDVTRVESGTPVDFIPFSSFR